MPEIKFVFTEEDNEKKFPTPISETYELVSLQIEANSLEGLVKAIHSMRIYFCFNFGTPKNNYAFSYHLSKYLWVTESIVNTINFKDEIIEIDSKYECTSGRVSIQNDVELPVVKMTLILNQH